MNVFDIQRKHLKDLPVIPPEKSHSERYFTILIFSGKKKADSGYAPMTIVPTKEKSIPGVLGFHPDSISLEPKEGITYHMDCLPKSGAIQIWATGNSQIKMLHVWGASTVYVEAE